MQHPTKSPLKSNHFAISRRPSPCSLLGMLRVVVIFGFLGFAGLCFAKGLVAQPPLLKTPIYLLMDAQSGRVLAAKNIHKHHPPASLAKMLTLYVAGAYLEKNALHLDDEVVVSENAWRKEGSRTFLKLGSSVTIETLIKGIVGAIGQ